MKFAAMIVLMLLLAGCSSPDEEVQSDPVADELPDSGFVDENKTVQQQPQETPKAKVPTNDTDPIEVEEEPLIPIEEIEANWWLMTTTPKPDGFVSGAIWNVPEDTQNTTRLELALLVPPGESIEAVEIQFYELTDKAELQKRILFTDFDGRIISQLGSENVITTTLEFDEPFITDVGFEPGDKFGITIASKGTASSLGLMFDFAADDGVNGYLNASDTIAEFVASKEAEGLGLQFSNTGEGMGWSYDIYLSYHYTIIFPGAPPTVFGSFLEIWTPGVTRTTTAPAALEPFVGINQNTISIGPQFAGGRTSMLAAISSFELLAGVPDIIQYQFDATAAGASYSDEGMIDSTVATTSSWAYPITAMGPGEANANLAVDYVATDGVQVVALELGTQFASVEDLLGYPEVGASAGAIARDGDDLVMGPSGEHRIKGILQGLPAEQTIG